VTIRLGSILIALSAALQPWANAQGDSAALAAPGVSVVAGPQTPTSDPVLFGTFPQLNVNAPVKAPVWPQRLAPQGSKLQGVCRDIPGIFEKPVGSPGYFPSEEREPTSLPGAVELLKWAGASEYATLRIEGPNSFRYSARPIEVGDPSSAPTDGPAAKPFRAAMTFEFMSARDVPGTTRATAAIDRTLFSLYSAAKGTKVRGVALMVPGMFGTPDGITESLAKRLRQDGWAVLRMWAHPARFTESMDVTITSNEPMDAQVAPWASEIDQRAAETAFASEAAFAHVVASNPEYAALPRVAVGFSGGAMVMCTVLAREPGVYTAAVMVGGGVDFWLMNERSNYASFINALAVKYEGFEKVEAAKVAANSAYLDASSLDSFHTAKHIGSTRVLLIQATQDRAVPSPLGDVLWERLRRPDRWVRVAGHEFLFANLRTEYDEVVEWIRKASTDFQPPETTGHLPEKFP